MQAIWASIGGVKKLFEHFNVVTTATMKILSFENGVQVVRAVSYDQTLISCYHFLSDLTTWCMPWDRQGSKNILSPHAEVHFALAEAGNGSVPRWARGPQQSLYHRAERICGLCSCDFPNGLCSCSSPVMVVPLENHHFRFFEWEMMSHAVSLVYTCLLGV